MFYKQKGNDKTRNLGILEMRNEQQKKQKG